MARKNKRVRKPMPKPSRPFKTKREAMLDRVVRKMLRDYHGTFIALGDE